MSNTLTSEVGLTPLPVTGAGPFTMIVGIVGLTSVAIGGLLAQIARRHEEVASPAGVGVETQGGWSDVQIAPAMMADAVRWLDMQLAPAILADPVRWLDAQLSFPAHYA